MKLQSLIFDVPPYRLSGVIYEALMNHKDAITELGEAAHQPPYKHPPVAPVLGIKPRNCLVGPDASVLLPEDAPEVEIGASLGIVISRAASRLRAHTALEWVAGYTIVNDISVPNESHYRPSVRFRARDGFCALGPTVIPREAVPSPDELSVTVRVDGRVVQHTSTSHRVRGVAKLLEDVTEFMTLSAGDVVLLGASTGAPRVNKPCSVRIDFESLGSLQTHFATASDSQRGAR